MGTLNSGTSGMHRDFYLDIPGDIVSAMGKVFRNRKNNVRSLSEALIQQADCICHCPGLLSTHECA